MAAVSGKAHLLGDNVDTDRIIPGKYTKTLDSSDLAAHLLEDYDADLRNRIGPGDCSSPARTSGAAPSREQAPIAIKAAGVSAVLARSFARIFFRNAINIGLAVVEVPEHEITDGARVSVDLLAGTVVDEDSGHSYRATRMPAVMAEILEAGGLVPYLRTHGGYEGSR